MTCLHIAAINDRMGKEMAEHYIWWLAFFNDLLAFNLLSQGKFDGNFYRYLQQNGRYQIPEKLPMCENNHK